MTRVSDPKWPASIRDKMPVLSALVLYRTTAGWRYAIYAGGVMDGRLTDVALDASEAEAQGALVRLVEEGTGRTIHAEWRPVEPNWWTAEAVFID